MAMRVSAALIPFAAACMLSTALLGAAQDGGSGDKHPSLPPGEGRDLTIRVCSTCHDVERVADQQLDEAGWKDLVDQMASKGAEATDAELTQIVQYLTKAFPATK